MDLQPFWKQLLQVMQKRIGHDEVEIWLKASEPMHCDSQQLLVKVSNSYYADWIRDNYLEVLCEEVSALIGRPMDVLFTYPDDPTSEASTPTQTETAPRGLDLNYSQTFDNFVVGECNKFAHAAARAVAELPAYNYNPLYIYGSTGLGKTHLMHAIGNEILRTQPNARVVYVTAEDFLNEMINGLRHKRMEDFRTKYRKRATCLLVDDIQFLSGRDRTQEEFFHTFNALQNAGRQIVLTSDMPPGEISKLEPRLRTRFEGGLLADMQAPDMETLLAILRQKSDEQDLGLPVDLSEAIATRVAGNIREVEGILNRLGAMKSLYNERLTLAFARRMLPRVFSPIATSISPAAILDTVARFYTIRTADLIGKRRTRTLTLPRQIAMYLARKHTSLSFPELGREFGGRDHSTIQYGCRKIEEAIPSNSELANKIRLIETALKKR